VTKDEILIRLRDLREEFRHVHERGTNALLVGDYHALREATDRERQLIDEQTKLLDTFQLRTR
jgi:hypothetical protein